MNHARAFLYSIAEMIVAVTGPGAIAASLFFLCMEITK